VSATNDPLVARTSQQQAAVRFHGLQVLRFIAALSIVAYHTGAYGRKILGIPAGEQGFVDFLNEPIFSSTVRLFFTLSGFVIAHSLESATPGRFFLLRGLRLFPGYWLAVLLVLGARCALWGFSPPAGWTQFCTGLLLLPGGAPNRFVLSVEWSLVYEIQFYVILGLLSFGGKRLVMIGTSLWLAICMTRLFISHGSAAPSNPGWGDIPFSIFNAYFLWGVVAYHLRDRGQSLRHLVPLAAPVFLLIQYVSQDLILIHLGWQIGYASIVWFMAGSTKWSADDTLVRYGDATYGIYLLHAPVLVIFDRLARDTFHLPPTAPLVLFSGALALAVAAVFGMVEAALYRRLRQWLVPAKKVHLRIYHESTAKAA
jgi:peptidoglycan/LPS O-acetylase OafA/YrhL